MGPLRPGKRGRPDETFLDGSTTNCDGTYLRVKLVSGKPVKSKGWPWVQLGVRGVLGDVERLEKASFLADGCLLIKTKNVIQTGKFEKIKTFANEECEVFRDTRLNTSRGTIRAYDLEDLTEEEIVEWLREYGVGTVGMDVRRRVPRLLLLLLLLAGVTLVAGQLNFRPAASAEQLLARDRCFCQLEGQVGDCECNVDTVDFFNNVKIFPRLQSLLVKDFFRFYKVNLKRSCPFWEDDGRCSQTTCRVKCCEEDELPIGLKAGAPIEIEEDPAYKYSEGAQKEKEEEKRKEKEEEEESCDEDESLGDLNTTISASRQRRLDDWTAHDDAQDNFCDVDDESSADMQFVDLLLNPERFTGYRGDSSTRVWSAIYNENCFKPKSASGSQNKYAPMVDSTNLGGLCLEERVFYRAISGLHTSITIHLCADYLLSEGCRGLDRLAPNTAKWGPNPAEFHRRFDPKTTYGQGPGRLKNLYFLYLLELRALAKAAPYLSQLEYFTGNGEEDEAVREAIGDVLAVISDFPSHFNESELFRGGKQARKLKLEFRDHFRNISRIMDCVGCEKCKLWGTLQTRGLGTALKILFSGNFDNPTAFKEGSIHPRKFQLSRNEIVALFNAFGRLSTSVRNLELFRAAET